MLRGLVMLALGVWIAAQSGCAEKTCPTIGCGRAFEVNFLPANGQWAAGTYSIAVTADVTSGACDVTLPLAPCTSSSESCQGTRDWDAIESGCALPAEQHAIGGIVFGKATPASVDVVVSLDGRQLAAETFVPTYQTSHPNGSDCPGTCMGAPSATLSIQP
jgi:hypothetical protein